MNFLDLQNFSLGVLDDVNAGYFTLPQIKLWLNLGQREVQKRLIGVGQNWYTKCVQTSTVINQNKYVMPQDMKKINALWIVLWGTSPTENNVKLESVTTNEQFLFSFNQGVPNIYTISKNSFNVFPYPDQVYTMRMIYTYALGDMVLDTDNPDVPDSYQELVALYGIRYGFIKDGRVNDLLERYISLYEKEAISDANERRQDKSRTIRKTGFTVANGSNYYW